MTPPFKAPTDAVRILGEPLRDPRAATFLPMSTLEHVVFAHDVRLCRLTDGRVLSTRGAWPWERYLAFSRSLTVAARLEEGGGEPLDGGQDVACPGVEFVKVPTLSGPLAALANRREARTILSSELTRADALVARLPSEIGLAAIREARRLGRPYAVEVVTSTWDALWYRGGLQGKLYAPVSRRSMQRAVLDAPYVLYVTREFLQRRYPTRGRAVACSNVELPPLEESALARRLDGIRASRTPFVLGMVAVLSVRFKGVQTALEALGRARDFLPEFELQIVGAGDPAPWRRLAAQHGVEDRVSF